MEDTREQLIDIQSQREIYHLTMTVTFLQPLHSSFWDVKVNIITF